MKLEIILEEFIQNDWFTKYTFSSTIEKKKTGAMSRFKAN